jgi:quercetin dioxygenase-like cupin family protein
MIALTKTVVAAAAIALAASLAGAAFAGECPADKRATDVTKPGAAASKEVSDVVLAAVDLSKEKAALPDRQLRLRKLEIKPGGIVAWHSHGDRPAIIYIVSGDIYEYASNCSVPVLHRPGDVSREAAGTAHWWQNTGNETVVLLSADILHDAKDHNM